ncbi:hypothetical protein [Paraburkholderia sp.]|jgi:hypothetical protein|uniref:hypothetical protein n=1 Tax=Paraburkholderia sp. TaxID=1926495 RepID=UPI002F3FD639
MVSTNVCMAPKWQNCQEAICKFIELSHGLFSNSIGSAARCFQTGQTPAFSIAALAGAANRIRSARQSVAKQTTQQACCVDAQTPLDGVLFMDGVPLTTFRRLCRDGRNGYAQADRRRLPERHRTDFQQPVFAAAARAGCARVHKLDHDTGLRGRIVYCV